MKKIEALYTMELDDLLILSDLDEPSCNDNNTQTTTTLNIPNSFTPGNPD